MGSLVHNPARMFPSHGHGSTLPAKTQGTSKPEGVSCGRVPPAQGMITAQRLISFGRNPFVGTWLLPLHEATVAKLNGLVMQGLISSGCLGTSREVAGVVCVAPSCVY